MAGARDASRIPSLTNGTLYRFQVRAVNSIGEGAGCLSQRDAWSSLRVCRRD